MDFEELPFGGELYTWDESEGEIFCGVLSFVNAVDGVVVGEGEEIDFFFDGALEQFGWREGAIGGGGV